MRRGLALALLVAGAAPAAAMPAAGGEASTLVEILDYRWQLTGVQGTLARLFGLFPPNGEAQLRISVAAGTILISDFRATSAAAAVGDHLSFRSRMDLAAGRTLEVRERLHYRGRSKNRERLLEPGLDALDVLAGLATLRRAPPTEPTVMLAFSAGKTYPVAVTPGELSWRSVGERRVPARRFALAGVREPGQRLWKARGQIWLSADDEAVPIEIVLERALGKLRLELVGRQRD